jgi:hypothetical protein
MRIPGSNAPLGDWFDRLVRVKMATVAVAVAGIAVSCFLLTFAKLFSNFLYYAISATGLSLLISSTIMFVYSAGRYVFFGVEGVEGRKGNRKRPVLADISTPRPAHVTKNTDGTQYETVPGVHDVALAGDLVGVNAVEPPSSHNLVDRK